MKQVILFTLLIILSTPKVFSQSNLKRSSAISMVEKTMYDEFYLGEKCYNKTTISFNDTTKSFEINTELFLGKNQNIKTKTFFYLDDIDLKSMKYDLYPTSDGLFFVTVNIDAIDKSIEVFTVEVNTKEFPMPVSSTEYQNVLVLSPTGKSLPKRIAMRFVENIKTMLGTENYRRVKLFK